MTSFLALIGQRSRETVAQGIEVPWLSLPQGIGEYDQRVLDLKAAFTTRAEMVPTGYSAPCTAPSARNDYPAVRIGTIASEAGHIGYLGIYNFAQAKKNTRGLIPVGVVFGTAFEETTCELTANAFPEIRRLFDDFIRATTGGSGLIERTLAELDKASLVKKWKLSESKFVTELNTAESGAAAPVGKVSGTTFIARGSSAGAELNAAVLRLGRLFSTKVDFDAFLAMRENLDLMMRKQADAGVVAYLGIEDFVAKAECLSLSLHRTQTNSESPETVKSLPFGTPRRSVDSVPPPPIAGPDLLREVAGSTSDMAFQLRLIWDRIASVDAAVIGSRQVQSRNQLRLIVILLLAALLALGYLVAGQASGSHTPNAEDTKSAADEAIRVLRQRQLQCLHATAPYRTQTSNSAWRLILQRAQEAQAGQQRVSVNNLDIPDVEEFVRASYDNYRDQLGECLSQ